MRSKLKLVLLVLCLSLIPLSSHGDTPESPVASFDVLERVETAVADLLEWLSASILPRSDASHVESASELEMEPSASSVSAANAEEAEEPTTQGIYGHVIPDG